MRAHAVPHVAVPAPACGRRAARPSLASAIGNRAMGRLLARTVADGQLTSPRFQTVDGAPEPRLEACFEDRARLRTGDRDPEGFGPVAMVQQALIDLGFDLGPGGSDGIYGGDTARAVRAFKASERLGFEQFGDVGPGTMNRLDELFPPTLPVCPTADDDIIVTVSARESARDRAKRCNPRRERDPDVKPGTCPPKSATPGVCGPDVSAEVARAWRSAQTQFKALSKAEKRDNCRMLIQPLIRDPDTKKFTLNADAFDTWGLFQNSTLWTRSPPWHGPCGTPGTTGDNCEDRDPRHECDTVCSNSVQIGGECWLTGTVNYGLFGVAMRACHDEFKVGDTSPFSLPATMALAGGYKAVKGDNVIGPEKWVIATWKGGPSATATGGNRPNCATTCPGPAPPAFSIIWEPHMTRNVPPLPTNAFGPPYMSDCPAPPPVTTI